MGNDRKKIKQMVNGNVGGRHIEADGRISRYDDISERNDMKLGEVVMIWAGQKNAHLRTRLM